MLSLSSRDVYREAFLALSEYQQQHNSASPEHLPTIMITTASIAKMVSGWFLQTECHKVHKLGPQSAKVISLSRVKVKFTSHRPHPNDDQAYLPVAPLLISDMLLLLHSILFFFTCIHAEPQHLLSSFDRCTSRLSHQQQTCPFITVFVLLHIIFIHALVYLQTYDLKLDLLNRTTAYILIAAGP